MNILNELYKFKDIEYAELQNKLTPSLSGDKFIGVKVPILKKLTKLITEDEAKIFLNDLPHKYFEENMLHGLLISKIKDYETCINELEKFLPYVDNWAVCDTISPKILKKHTIELIQKVKEWSKSTKVYTCRFGIKILMNCFLDENFKNEYLEIPMHIHTDEYYIKMMIAWFYATALAKQWEDTIPYLKENKLDAWIHNKTIQKARESYRITDKQKEYLKTLKRK